MIGSTIPLFCHLSSGGDLLPYTCNSGSSFSVSYHGSLMVDQFKWEDKFVLRQAFLGIFGFLHLLLPPPLPSLYFAPFPFPCPMPPHTLPTTHTHLPHTHTHPLPILPLHCSPPHTPRLTPLPPPHTPTPTPTHHAFYMGEGRMACGKRHVLSASSGRFVAFLVFLCSVPFNIIIPCVCLNSELWLDGWTTCLHSYTYWRCHAALHTSNLHAFSMHMGCLCF